MSSLTGMFVGVHVTLAQLTGTPELAITMEEGDSFMKAAQKVASHYSVSTTQKTMDWIAFLGCAGGMYLPRVFVIAQRKREEAEAVRNRRGAPAAAVNMQEWPADGLVNGFEAAA